MLLARFNHRINRAKYVLQNIRNYNVSFNIKGIFT